MQSGSVEITPGKVFNEQDGETVDLEKLNRMISEAVLRVMEKSITAREIADNAITSDQLDVDLSAQLGVPDGSVTLGKLADGFLLSVLKGGTGASSPSGARANLECLRTDFEYVALSGIDPASSGETDLSKTNTGADATNTYTYVLADLEGTGLDTDEIRTLYVTAYAHCTSGNAWVDIEYPDGTVQRVERSKTTNNSSQAQGQCVVPVPINPGQTTVDVKLTTYGDGVAVITLAAVSQRIFEGY